MTTTGKILAALTTLLVAACGGGSDETGAENGGPQASAALVSGAVQSTSGGLVVNGITFRTSGAHLTTDAIGAPITLSGDDAFRGHVREGMIVRVRGSHDGSSGRADEIELHDLLEGAIDDRGPGRVRVAGVEVSTDDSTVFDDGGGRRIGSDDLSTGERVEIGGHSDGRGGIRATSIRRSASSELEQEVRAWVVAASGGVLDLSFEKGGALALRADVSGISPAPAIAVGDLVEVKLRGAARPDGVLVATAIHREDDRAAGTGLRVEIEGIVSAADAAGFVVAGQRVAYTAATAFVGGTIDDVFTGVKVEAQGAIDADGVLAATKVKFRPVVRIDANVEAVNAAGSSITLLGFTVRVTPATDLRGSFDLSSLPAGARVEVRGSPTRDGNGIDAMRIELVDTRPNDRAFLRGVVSEKLPTSLLRVLGLPVDTRGASFRDHADAEIGAAAFFDAVIPGETVVKVRWRPYPASTADAVDEAELEND